MLQSFINLSSATRYYSPSSDVWKDHITDKWAGWVISLIKLKNKTMSKDNFFSEENEAKAGWFKFENIGDSIKGTLLSTNIKPARDMFPEQTVYELKTEDGDIMNVASSKDFVRKAMSRASVGQIVGFKYDSDYQTDANKKKGMAPAKTIKVYLGDMDPNYDAMAGLTDVTPGDDGEVSVEDIF